MIAEHAPQGLSNSPEEAIAFSRFEDDGAFVNARFTDADFRQDSEQVAFAEATARQLHAIDPVYEILGALRDTFGDFILQNLHARPNAGFLEPTRDFPDADQLVVGVKGAIAALTQIYHALSDRSALSLNYRAVIINTNTQLKSFLLALTQFDIVGGINRSELPMILGACIEVEKTMAAHVQQLDILKSGIGASDGS